MYRILTLKLGVEHEVFAPSESTWDGGGFQPRGFVAVEFWLGGVVKLRDT